MENVINNSDYTTLCSNLVYPLDSGFKLIAKLDDEFVKEELLKIGHHRIGNKYAVVMNGKLWYQHDNSTWVIEKPQK